MQLAREQLVKSCFFWVYLISVSSCYSVSFTGTLCGRPRDPRRRRWPILAGRPPPQAPCTAPSHGGGGGQLRFGRSPPAPRTAPAPRRQRWLIAIRAALPPRPHGWPPWQRQQITFPSSYGAGHVYEVIQKLGLEEFAPGQLDGFTASIKQISQPFLWDSVHSDVGFFLFSLTDP